MLEFSESARLPTAYGEFLVRGFRCPGGPEHLAVYVGDIGSGEPVLARVHSECLTGEVFQSRRCDCARQLAFAMAAVMERGRGVIVYLRQEGRGIGLFNKVRAYHLQDHGLDTVRANTALGFPVDARSYEVAGEILSFFHVKAVELMTNNVEKVRGLCGCGISVVRRIGILVDSDPLAAEYMAAKRTLLGHDV